MTAPHARQPQVLPRPACTPAAIRAVLAANAGNEVLRQYDEDLDTAFEQALTTSLHDGSLRSYGASGSNSARTPMPRSVCRLAVNAGWLAS